MILEHYLQILFYINKAFLIQIFWDLWQVNWTKYYLERSQLFPKHAHKEVNLWTHFSSKWWIHFSLLARALAKSYSLCNSGSLFSCSLVCVAAAANLKWWGCWPSATCLPTVWLGNESLKTVQCPIFMGFIVIYVRSAFYPADFITRNII